MASITPDPARRPVGQKVGDIDPDPSSHAEVLQSEHRKIWKDVEARELEGMRANGTFTSVTAPPGRSAIRARQVHNLERYGLGKVTKVRARMIAKRFRENSGVDHDEMFAVR